MAKVTVRTRKNRGLEMVWKDPASGKTRSRKCKTNVTREAEREAAVLEAKINEGKEGYPISWSAFVNRARKEMYPLKSDHYTRTIDQVIARWNSYAENPGRNVNEIHARDIAGFRQYLTSKVRQETVEMYLRHLKALFGWGLKSGTIHHAPNVKISTSKKSDAVRKQIVHESAFVEIAQACRECRPNDHEAWLRFIEGMWACGLRINEALILSWDEGPFQFDLISFEYPVFRILAEGQKSYRDEFVPMTPDFHRWVVDCCGGDGQTGNVFGITVCRNRASNIVAEILTRAMGRRCTAHDLRRSFATRWAMKVKPAVLMRLMRHSDIHTTMKYYVILEAVDVAKVIWES